MKRLHLAQSFDQYFEIVFANTTELQRESYRIRHQVYSEELGWEPPRDSRMEMDAYDEFSHSILLRHKRTGAFVGTVRLVLPPPELPHATLPFEDNCLDSMMLDVVDPGVGFEVHSIDRLPTRQGGFGLFSIRERLKLMGGSIDIHSIVGEGTTVRIRPVVLAAD